MILVTGATGTIGSRVVQLLAGKGTPARAMTRDASKVPATPGVEVVQADFDDRPSLKPAVDGVDTVFLLTAPVSPSPAHDRALLDAARGAGVRRVVRLSAIGSGETTDDGSTLGAWHAEAEQAVRDSGLEWTMLRPTTFASNMLWWAAAVQAGEPIRNMTGDGRQGIVDPRDVAAVAAEILTSTGHEGRTYTLTGPELMSVPEQAAVLAEVLGRPVDVVDHPLDVARAAMLADGMDPAVVATVITGSAWVRDGRNAIVTDDVERLLGRPSTTFADWARDHRSAFAEP